MDPAVSNSELITIEQLPTFDDVFGHRWGPDMDGLFTEFFDSGIEGPIQHPGGAGIVVLHNADLRKLAGRKDLTNTPAHLQVPEEMPATRAHLDKHIFGMIGEKHAAMRKVFMPPFMPNTVHRFVPQAEAAIERALADVVDRGEVDFLTDIAQRATGYFWGSLYGISDDELETIHEMLPAFYPLNTFGPSEADIQGVEKFLHDFHTMVEGYIQRSLDNDPPDYLAEMALAFESISTDKPRRLADMLASIAHDGFHSQAIGFMNIFRELFVRADAWEAVRRDPSLVPRAFDEGIRLAPPTSVTPRFATEDFEFKGVAIPRGTQVNMLWLAGNRDPKMFADPTRYDLTRKAAGQVTFGGGLHLCSGRAVLRMFTEVALARLASVSLDIRATGPTDLWEEASGEYHLVRLPVSITTT